MDSFNLKTDKTAFYDITAVVKQAVKASQVIDGICIVYCPHTTAGITINENCDENVGKDVNLGFDEAFPNRESFMHDEGNSAGHIKSSVVGASQTLIIEKGQLVLGRWQAIYFAEFDPPRNRSYYVKIIKG